MKTGNKYIHPSIIKVESLTEKLILLNQQLEEKNCLLEQSEKARKNMFSNITHDLRAPVSVIRGAVDRLYSNNELNDKERLKLLKIIDIRAATLEQLIEDMFYSALIADPDFSLSLQCLEIAPMLEEYFISLEEAGYFGKRHSYLDIPDGCSVRAMIDLRYFFRVLDNLMANAIFYTKESDRIELSSREIGNSVEIILFDSGSGIPSDKLPYIFDRTFTGTSARTPGKSGSGLGLSIARTIVEKHGGTIRCDSSQSEGTRFTVSLPLA